MKWSPRAYDRACRDYFERQVATDETLYNLCRRYPDHKTFNAVFAKVSIIGRTYATGIERLVPTHGGQSDSRGVSFHGAIVAARATASHSAIADSIVY